MITIYTTYSDIVLRTYNTVYSFQCALYIAYCTLYSVHCTLYTVQCTLTVDSQRRSRLIKQTDHWGLRDGSTEGRRRVIEERSKG